MLLGDFYIIDIQFDPQTGLAILFKICEPRESRPGPNFWASRAEIIELLGDGYTVEPMPEKGRPAAKRQLMRAIELDGKVYLRTDGAELAGDWINGFREHRG